MDSFDDASANLPTFEMSAASVESQLDQLRRLAGSEPRRSPRRLRRGLTVVLGVCVLAGAGVGVAAAFGVFSRPPSERGVAHCYTTADLDGPRTTFGVAVGPATEGLGDAAAAALNICQMNWRSGAFLLSTPEIQQSVDPNGPVIQQAPHLAVCVLGSGAVAVFPGSAETCERLGLAVADL